MNFSIPLVKFYFCSTFLLLLLSLLYFHVFFLKKCFNYHAFGSGRRETLSRTFLYLKPHRFPFYSHSHNISYTKYTAVFFRNTSIKCAIYSNNLFPFFPAFFLCVPGYKHFSYCNLVIFIYLGIL